MANPENLPQIPKPVVAEVNGLRVVLLTSIILAGEEERDAIVISGSHGGASAGEHASGQPIAMAFFNDAGLGREDAGVAGLLTLQSVGIPAGAVMHTTARIADPADSWNSGVISRLNAAAKAAGLREGESLQQEVLRFLDRLAG